MFGFWRIEPEPLLVRGHGQAETVGAWLTELEPACGDLFDLVPDSPWPTLRHGVLAMPSGDVDFGPCAVAGVDAHQLCTISDYSPYSLNGGLTQLKEKAQAGIVEHTGIELREVLGSRRCGPRW